jgi:hypothetical protein
MAAADATTNPRLECDILRPPIRRPDGLRRTLRAIRRTHDRHPGRPDAARSIRPSPVRRQPHSAYPAYVKAPPARPRGAHARRLGSPTGGPRRSTRQEHS